MHTLLQILKTSKNDEALAIQLSLMDNEDFPGFEENMKIEDNEKSARRKSCYFRI